MIQDARGCCTGTTQRDGMGSEVGGGFRMGNLFEKRHDADRNGIAAADGSINGDKGISLKFPKQPSRIPVLISKLRRRPHLAPGCGPLCISSEGPSGRACALCGRRSVSVCVRFLLGPRASAAGIHRRLPGPKDAPSPPLCLHRAHIPKGPHCGVEIQVDSLL